MLAHSRLQLVAFAVRPTTARQYASGLVREVFTWVGVIVAAYLAYLIVAPVALYVSGIVGLLFVLYAGKTVLPIAIGFHRRAKRYRIRPHKVLQHDNRIPILYLRAFSEDYSEGGEGFFQTTHEENLVAFYDHYGPVVAVGEPDEDIPILGATRLHFDDSTWQPGVLYLMSLSQAVIIHAGFAPGVLWELGVARQRLEPEKLIISFAAWKEMEEEKRNSHYLRFKRYAEELLECELPLSIKLTTYLSFESGWKVRERRLMLILPPSLSFTSWICIYRRGRLVLTSLVYKAVKTPTWNLRHRQGAYGIE